MADLINLLPSGLSPSLTENAPSLQIANMPAELVARLRPGIVAELEVYAADRAVIRVDNQTFNILLSTNLFKLNLPASLSVRVGTEGQLIPIKAETIRPAPPSSENTLPQLDIQPLKLGNFIESTLKEMKAPQTVRQQLVSEAPRLETALVAFNAEADVNSLVVEPLQNILRQIATSPQSVSLLRPGLNTAIEQLAGQQIIGKITDRVGDMTRLQTPLGETFFVSKIKLPPETSLRLNITNVLPAVDPEISLLDNLLKMILPGTKLSVKPEQLAAFPSFKNMAALAKTAPEAFMAAVKHLPLQPDNLLRNIYQFYQAATHKNLAQWLGKDMNALTGLDSEVRTRAIENLHTFMVSSLRETPSWRLIEMPLFDGVQIKPLKVAIKKDEDSSKQKKAEKKGRRFILETEFSHLGSFQFDGFAIGSRRRFDLIIRTSKPVADDFCSNIINLFKKSLYDLNYTGTVKINRQESFINIMADEAVTEGIYV